jgi:outer membrane lipoprotein carrier protein
MNFILRLTAFLLAAAALGAQQAPPSARDLAKLVEKRYDRVSSMRAEFTEVYRGAGIARTESGTLWLKKPGRMRWEYREPREKLFVSDGKTAYFYVPGENQARRAPLNKLDDLRTPLRFLLGKADLEKELDGLSFAYDVPASTPANRVIRGVPKSMADRVAQVLFEVTPEGQIARVVAEELDGSITEFQFRNVQENPAIAAEQFKFSPPRGVEMIETTEVAP